METDHSTRLVTAESLRRKHEAAEPRLRGPAIIMASIVVMILLCLATTAALMFFLSQKRPMQHMQALGLLVAPDENPLERFPGPTLQLDDGFADSTSLRQRQISKLKQYAWVNRSNGVVRIPIERAIDLMLADGSFKSEPPVNNFNPLQLNLQKPSP